jgi:zinc protease
MKSATRLALLLGGAAILMPLAHAGAQGQAPSPVWIHQASDLQPDPAARFGALPNGMRYVIYRNATPPGQVAVRLRFAAGDLMEQQDQNGLAHFIEHMAFNGTTNIPEGEFVRILERQGLAFGRDTNAFTAPDQTVYELNIPASNDAKIDTALFVMREVASEIKFGAEAIERERGIIQSEDRSMYPPTRRAGVERDRFLLQGQLISRRLDIGDLDVIRTAPRERFVDYYRKYYRPERATLVIVGDVDPAAVEAKIRTRFADWQGQGPAGAEPDLGRPAPRQAEAGSSVVEGALREVSISFIKPYTHDPDSRADRVARMRRNLALAVLNRRLRRIAESADAPFASAFAYNADRYRSVEQTTVGVEPKPGKEEAAVRVVEQEVRRVAEHGVLDSELQREIVDARTGLQAAVAGAATRQTRQLADMIVQTVNADRVVLAPTQSLALFEEAVRGFNGQAAHALAREMFTGSGPLLFATSPEPIPGGHAQLAQALVQSRQTPVQAPVAVAAKAWPYQSFGTPGTVAQREEIADLGVTRVRFANGVTLLVKPTQFDRDQVMVSVRVGGGRLALRPELVTFPLNTGAFIQGGLEQLNQDEIREALAGKVVGTSFGIGDDALVLGGGTRPQDFATQMQLLAAYVTSPGWRQDAFDRTRTQMQNAYSAIYSSPRNLGSIAFERLVRSNDARWGFPSREELAAAQLPPLRAAIEPMLRSAPIEVTVVGDITVDEAIAQVGATFGALPQRQAQAPRIPGLERISFARRADVERLRHSGRPDVAFGLVAWQTDDFYDDVAETRAVNVLRSIVQIRAIEKLREELGATYSPSVLNQSSDVFDEFGLLGIAAEVNPSQLDRLMQIIGEVAEGLKTGQVSADELNRAREPMLLSLASDKASNSYWLGRLGGASWDPRLLETIRNQEQMLRAVTPADIQRLARKYLINERAYRLAVDPPATPTASAN